MFVKEDKIILIIIIILILKQRNIMDIDIFINLIKIRLAIPPSTIRYSVSYRSVITSLILIKLIFFYIIEQYRQVQQLFLSYLTKQ